MEYAHQMPARAGMGEAGCAAPVLCRPAALPPVQGFLETSFIDWPGKLCAVLFLGGCNFRCPFCHNHALVLAPERLEAIAAEAILARLAARRTWLDGVCVSGGEPTLHAGLPSLLAFLKEEGWAVKLDTNGSRPEVLELLLAEGLVDMVAMDVKAPLVQALYDRCAGVPVDLAAVEKSIALLQQGGIAHEFRMTVCPALHSPADVRAWAARLSASPASRLHLQNFRPLTTLDPRFESEEGFAPDAFARLQAMAEHSAWGPNPAGEPLSGGSGL